MSPVNYAQLFCTVADLVADADAPGVDDVRMMQAIREASEYLAKEIGWFVPVTATRKYHGHGKLRLSVHPLLSVSSITNYGTALTIDDYLIKPDGGLWPDGPYVHLLVDPEPVNIVNWYDIEDGVVVTGQWGKYARSGDTGATVQDDASQSESQLTLKVSNGSKVSPGMVLLIGSEQELVTGWSDPTNNVTALNGAIDASQDVITVDNGALLNVGEVMRVGFEQMLVKSKRNHQAHVVRGWNQSGQTSHADNAEVDVYRTVNVERGMNGTTAAVHLKDAAISRYFAPNDIQFLTKEIATLIVNKAKSGYQGRTGNEELGVVFYNDAFPKSDIARLKEAYFAPPAT